MAEITLSLSDTALARLRELAAWTGVSIEDALEQAINERYDHKFWDAVNAGYAALRASSKDWAEIEAERRLWDKALLDGLSISECWTEEGDVRSATTPCLLGEGHGRHNDHC